MYTCHNAHTLQSAKSLICMWYTYGSLHTRHMHRCTYNTWCPLRICMWCTYNSPHTDAHMSHSTHPSRPLSPTWFFARKSWQPIAWLNHVQRKHRPFCRTHDTIYTRVLTGESLPARNQTASLVQRLSVKYSRLWCHLVKSVGTGAHIRYMLRKGMMSHKETKPLNTRQILVTKICSKHTKSLFFTV